MTKVEPRRRAAVSRRLTLPRLFTCAAVSIAFASACGDSAPYAASKTTPVRPTVSFPRVARPAAAPTASIVVPLVPAPAASVAAADATIAPARAPAPIERAPALRRFFEALGTLEEGVASEDVRVMQLGDSHTAADWYTGVVRRLLQSRFGDGGRGFVAIGKPWKGYVQDGVRVGMSREWLPEHARLVGGRLVGDGHYGLSGVAVQSAKRGGSAWVDVQDAERIELAYLAQPSGGAFDLFVDGTEVVRVATKAAARGVRFRGLDVEPGAHHIEVHSLGHGKVRLFGAALDRKSKGVVLDAFGRDGARAAGLLHWNAEHFSALLKWRKPALVVLAFGTNECGDKDIPTATYERDLAELVGRIVRATPAAACLLLGPPDYVQYGIEGPMQHPRLAEIMAAQRRVAEAAQCAFYDQVAAMGGPGSIAQWAQAQPPRARKDGVHLSREGYAQLGSMFVDEVQRAYGAFKADRKPPTRPDDPVAQR